MGLFTDPKRTEVYVPKEEREKPENERISFKIRVLTAREYEMRKDLVQGTDPNQFFKMGTWTMTTLRSGLVGVEGPGAPNFETGPSGMVSDDFLDLLMPQLRDELAGAIDRLCRIGPEELFA